MATVEKKKKCRSIGAALSCSELSTYKRHLATKACSRQALENAMLLNLKRIGCSRTAERCRPPRNKTAQKHTVGHKL